jgi:predicted small secreted protein
MTGSKLPWCAVLGLALLVAVSGCANTIQGARRDVDHLLANRWNTGDATPRPASAPASASTDNDTADEWVDPR